MNPDIVNASPPARPHHNFTEDGRRVREVLSYSRRGSRFNERQAEAWDAHRDTWVVPEEAVEDPGFTWTEWFGREAPLVVEIGSGVGEATVALAAARPEVNVLAFEVWRPGIAETLGRLDAAGVDNVRLCSIDAVWSMEQVIGRGALADLWTFFPDPWRKARHHKRRLITPSYAALVASRLAPGATWRLATDWVDYAEAMIEVLDAEPLLTGGVVERWAERPLTRFERKGLATGRTITDLAYRRRPGEL